VGTVEPYGDAQIRRSFGCVVDRLFWILAMHERSEPTNPPTLNVKLDEKLATR
jgi:hypothetical protein